MVSAWTEVGNLSPVAATKRLRGALVILGVGLMLGVVLAKVDVHWAWRAVLFAPFFVAANGFFQGLYRT